METYAEFRPTAFDRQGAFLPDRQDWLVVPVGQTRDSGPLEQSNFQQALEMLGGESRSVEVHRFNHWGPGWFEIIIVSPRAKKRIAIAEDIEQRLSDYPVLSEEDYSRREWEDFCESWEQWGAQEFVRHLKNQFDLSDNAERLLLHADKEAIREFYMNRAGCPYESDSSGVSIHFRASDWTRSGLATLLRQLRRVPVNT